MTALQQWLASLDDSWFESSALFSKHVLYSRVVDDNGDELSDVMKGFYIFKHYELLEVPKCCRCHAKQGIVNRGGQQRAGRKPDLAWLCAKDPSWRHFRQPITVKGLTWLQQSRWLPWLDFVVRMGLNQPLKHVIKELTSIGSACRATVYNWEKRFHQSVTNFVELGDINVIGGTDEHCSIDETSIGKLGWMCGKRAYKSGGWSRKKQQGRRIVQRLPGQTIWKKGARALPRWKPGTAKDKRSHSTWVWLAVTVGKKETRTHGGRLAKRVAATVLKHPKQAVAGKPRGGKELARVIKHHLKEGSRVVADGWKGTEEACRLTGHELRQCQHKDSFRAPDGTHSNDAESEVAKLRLWWRTKWSKVRTKNTRDAQLKQRHLQGHLAEFVLQTNLGDGMQLPFRVLLAAACADAED